ncbi:MAG TPA: alpha/beta hydrolase [Geminicoccaceae bacterium]|nr:alpha/beta hydrolase [Geminicoccaceae bacterium]
MTALTSHLMQAGGRLAAALLVALPAAGCGPKLLNALVPDGGYRVEGDLAYGALPRQRLDVYVPDGLAGPAPVAVFFYGGRWESGNKEQFRFVGQALAARGFITVIPDYRRYPEVRFPTFVEDGAAAVAWVGRNIGRFGGDPAQVHLMGHSAGAHIAALLALDRRYFAAAGTESDIIQSFIGLAGPYDFLPLTSATLKRIFAADDMAETQPITFADGNAPPALLLHGENDGTVLPANSERLAAALAAAGNRVEIKLYPNLDHVALVAALAAPLRWLAPVLDDVTAFLSASPPPSF